MRCIFCKSHSSSSKSVEHIIPESIGNTKYTLGKGVVCDKCNNYFARKIEGPLLSHTSFRNLRAWYQIPTKKGVKPRLYGFIAGTDIDIGLRVSRDGSLDIQPEFESDRARFLDRQQLDSEGEEPNIYIFPRDFDPPKELMSRFLAKMALESLALRFSRDSSLLDLIVKEVHYDLIRTWVRRGECDIPWPYYYRKIFPEETLMRHPASNEWVQVGYGFDLLLTKRPETYFVFSLYGHEFAINLGGPSIKGYEEWLIENKYISPLIERVGLKLEKTEKDGIKKSFLIDSETPETVADYDQTHFVQRTDGTNQTD